MLKRNLIANLQKKTEARCYVGVN